MIKWLRARAHRWACEWIDGWETGQFNLTEEEKSR